MLETIIRHRRALHRIPETGYDLPKTQAYLWEELKKLPVELKAVSPAGIFAYLDFGKEETIAFRADMDALPMEEKSGCPFSSEHPGKMHACGHDAHMAVMLALTQELSKKKAANKNALFIFQPAEEAGNGAKVMVEDGEIQRRNVTEIYACHVEPLLKKGAIASRPGAFMARSCEVHVFGHGKSAHIAHADEGVDALEMCARFYIRALDLIEKKYKYDMHLFKFGRFLSGTANNVLSNLTQIDGSLRAFDDEVFFNMKKDLNALALEIQSAFGGRIEVVTDEGYPPVINDKRLFERLQSACTGRSFVSYDKPHMTAEDFSCYLKAVPGLMFNVGLGVDTELHSNTFAFSEDALIPALETFLALFESA